MSEALTTDDGSDDEVFLTYTMGIHTYATTTGAMTGATNAQVANGMLHALALLLARQPEEHLQASASQFAQALIELVPRYRMATTPLPNGN